MATPEEIKARRKAARHLYDGGTPSVRGQIAKIIILGLIDAFTGTIFFALLGKNQITFAVILAAVTLILNWIYLRKGGLPAKYLAPGVILLICFQIYTVIFSGYIAFTNYGSLHNGNYESALSATMLAALEPVDGADYDIKVVKGADGVLQSHRGRRGHAVQQAGSCAVPPRPIPPAHRQRYRSSACSRVSPCPRRA